MSFTAASNLKMFNLPTQLPKTTTTKKTHIKLLVLVFTEKETESSEYWESIYYVPSIGNKSAQENEGYT